MLNQVVVVGKVELVDTEDKLIIIKAGDGDETYIAGQLNDTLCANLEELANNGSEVYGSTIGLKGHLKTEKGMLLLIVDKITILTSNK